MKTTRLSAANYPEPSTPAVTAPTNPLNLNNDTTNDSKPQMTSDNKVNSSSSGSTSKAGSIDPGTGLVRRLSVTARPGDIFYKVKDVTESSTSDSIDLPDVTDATLANKQNDSQQKVQVNKSYTIRTNDEANSSVAGHLKSPPLVTNATSFGSLGRKTTTWNSKRNQTTNLGINTNQVTAKTENESSKVKDDYSIETNKTNLAPANGHVEPGSPLFNKELLSIR